MVTEYCHDVKPRKSAEPGSFSVINYRNLLLELKEFSPRALLVDNMYVMRPDIPRAAMGWYKSMDKQKQIEHVLKDCFLVWYGPFLRDRDVREHEEICEQGWADHKLNGINKEDARGARKRC